MTLSYQALTTYEEDNWDEFLNKVCLIDIFRDLFEVVEKEEIKYAIRYIAMCYSIDSDAVLLGSEWFTNKKRIFDKSGLTEKHVDAFLNLNNDVVLKVINRWLNFQDNDTFYQLAVLRDLKIEMQRTANSNIRKSSGEVDYKQKYDNALYAMELAKKIKDLELELIQNNYKLKDAVLEVKTASRKNSLAPEMFAN